MLTDGVSPLEFWTDIIISPYEFGKPFRLIGGGEVECSSSRVDRPNWARSHASGSAAWDVVTAMTWGDDYLSLDDYRIFSCSGEFDLNWPP
jgi:hypothetical protein